MSRVSPIDVIRTSSSKKRGKEEIVSRQKVSSRDATPKISEGEPYRWEQYIDRESFSSILTSVLLHAIIILILAFIVVRPEGGGEVLYLIVNQQGKGTDEVEILTEISISDAMEEQDEAIEEPLPVSVAREETSSAQKLEENFLDPLGELSLNLQQIPDLDINTDFGGRSSATREKLLKMFGGNTESELAVRNGLRWLSQRQLSDGSWSFDHRRRKDSHKDHQAGRLKNCKTGATGLALMAFLGAGETQKQGRYKKRVEKGLKFLVDNAVKVPEGYDLRGRNGPNKDQIPGGSHVMYAHALATIAICEAYAMTKDRRLRPVAQGAVNFIVETRNKELGGWRYSPGHPGDLSVTGWMVMAIQSGKTAGLRVSDVAFKNVTRYLDASQSARGSQYGYVPGQSGKPSTTSIGLLCRMYLGWEKENPALQSGVFYLSEQGPSSSNMYYNYYATQVMHHSGGETWTKWNLIMRDSLIESQLKRGYEKGSWNVTDPHGNSGGRLYQTCLCVMTLEVYYRHLPLYQMRH